MRVTINKIFYDRRATKPRWFCRIEGGRGPNAENIVGISYGCCRAIAYVRALREWIKMRRTRG